MIPSVAASERGRAQTGSLRTSGVEGRHKPSKVSNRRPFESGTKEGKSPVSEREDRAAGTRVPQGT